MHSWEQTLAKAFHLLGLDLVRRRILVFALLGTLIPSLTTGWISYSHNKRALTEKTHEELRTAAAIVAREFDLWLKERVYELRVFASSYELSENVDKALRRGGTGQRAQILRRAHDYLKSVKSKFSDYEELIVLGPSTDTVVASVTQPSSVSLPNDWQRQAKLDMPIVSDARWDERLRKSILILAVPLKSVDGRFLGVLAARLNLGSLHSLVRQFSLGQTGHVFLVTPHGTRAFSSRPDPQAVLTTKLPEPVVRAFFDKEPGSLVRVSYEEREVLAVFQRATRLDWGVVAERTREEAFGALRTVRNFALLLTAGLLLAVGLIAYIVSLTIVRPLTRLTQAAAKASSGDLSVEVASEPYGETGYLISVFNSMVANLRRTQEELASVNQALSERNKELEILSTTDPLTGLHNRRYLMETLTAEVQRHQRYDRHCALLMIDLDHFKRYNDTFGHQAGDELLKKAAGIFKAALRASDSCARFGGEEFVIVLPDQDRAGMLVVAERIRGRIAAETADQAHRREAVTVSIGAAVFPDNGKTADALLASADAALYRAKGSGRNCVKTAGAQRSGK